MRNANGINRHRLKDAQIQTILTLIMTWHMQGLKIVVGLNSVLNIVIAMTFAPPLFRRQHHQRLFRPLATQQLSRLFHLSHPNPALPQPGVRIIASGAPMLIPLSALTLLNRRRTIPLKFSSTSTILYKNVAIKSLDQMEVANTKMCVWMRLHPIRRGIRLHLIQHLAL